MVLSRGKAWFHKIAVKNLTLGSPDLVSMRQLLPIDPVSIFHGDGGLE